MERILDEVKKMSWEHTPCDGSYSPTMEMKTSAKHLEELRTEYGDIPRSNQKNRIKCFTDQANTLIPLFEKHLGVKVQCQGVFIYPHTNSFVGWHTDSDRPGKRYYIIWCADSCKSYFRYEHNDIIHTKYDEPGWSMNTFDSGHWHCVGNDGTMRISIGYKELS